jgi:hypothetical protein
LEKTLEGKKINLLLQIRETIIVIVIVIIILIVIIMNGQIISIQIVNDVDVGRSDVSLSFFLSFSP